MKYDNLPADTLQRNKFISNSSAVIRFDFFSTPLLPQCTNINKAKMDNLLKFKSWYFPSNKHSKIK